MPTLPIPLSISIQPDGLEIRLSDGTTEYIQMNTPELPVYSVVTVDLTEAENRTLAQIFKIGY